MRAQSMKSGPWPSSQAASIPRTRHTGRHEGDGRVKGVVFVFLARCFCVCLREIVLMPVCIFFSFFVFLLLSLVLAHRRRCHSAARKPGPLRLPLARNGACCGTAARWTPFGTTAGSCARRHLSKPTTTKKKKKRKKKRKKERKKERRKERKKKVGGGRRKKKKKETEEERE